MEIQVEHLVALFAAIFACDGFWSYVRYKAENRRAKDVDQEAVKTGLLALLHDRIYQLGEFYILSGYITFDEFDNLTYLYKPYEALKGNSTGTDIYEKCKALPREKEKRRVGPNE